MQTRYGFSPPKVPNDISLTGLGNDFNDWLSQQDPSVQTEYYAAQGANPSSMIGPVTSASTIGGIPTWALFAGAGLIALTVLMPRGR